MSQPASPESRPATATSSAGAERSKILIVDNHPIVRQGLAMLINGEPDMTVTGEAASADEAIDVAARTSPDAAIIDIFLEGGRSGIELIKELAVRQPGLAMLALSMHEESLYAERVLRAGGHGYIMKQQATRNVLDALRRVMGGQIYLSPEMSTRLLRRVAPSGKGSSSAPKPAHASPLADLSDRELEVFTMIGQGLQPRQIAEQLFISVKTVETHRERIKEKLALANGVELTRRAMQYVMEQG